MDFTVEQHFEARPASVLELYADPEFHASLGAGQHIGPPDVVHHERQGDLVVLDIRYRFTADLPSAARRFVEAERLTWVEKVRIDTTQRSATSTLVADHYASLLTATARTSYREDGSGCLRQIEGRLSVKVPLVGSKVERAIVGGIREHLDLEAGAAAKRLSAS